MPPNVTLCCIVAYLAGLGEAYDFSPISWPLWIGGPEPKSLQQLPGGVASASVVLVLCFSLLWQCGKILSATCRRKRGIDAHEEASRTAGGADALKGCIGPKIVIVFKQQEECKIELKCCKPLVEPLSPVRDALISWLENPTHVVCVPVKFPVGSDLHGYEVWVVGIQEESLMDRFECFAGKKPINNDLIHSRMGSMPRRVARHSMFGHRARSNLLHPESWFEHRVADVERKRMLARLKDSSGKFNIWLPYKKKHKAGIYKADNNNFFSPHETMGTILGVLGRALDPKTGVPVLLAACEVGEIEAIFPLVDQERDKREYTAVLKSWKAFCYWRKPPVEDLARLFGASTAIYFSYMQLYAKALVVPALTVIGSLVYHLHYREARLNVHWGAAFNEGWTQAAFCLFLSLWSTMLFVSWSGRIENDVWRLGQDQVHKDLNTIDGTHLYFKRRGCKLTPRRGVYIDKWYWYRPARNKTFLAVFMTTIIALFLGISCIIIAGLCWISNMASKIEYSKNPHVDDLLKNVISAAAYLVVSMPLQGIYDKLVYWMTDCENWPESEQFVERVVRLRALFQLVNYLGWFGFLGFWVQDVAALRSQLMVFFLFKPSGLLGTFIDLLQLPSFRHREYEGNQITQMIEQEWRKKAPNLFEEYLEITLVFAAAICFAPVFPEGLVIALLHTIFEYFGDKNKLYTHERVQLPLQSDFFAVRSWVAIWDGLGWIGIFVSTWLVNIFLSKVHLSEEQDAWDPDPIRDSSYFSKWLPGLSADQRRIFTVVLLEHLCIVCKAYTYIAEDSPAKEVERHREVVHAVLMINEDEDFTTDLEPAGGLQHGYTELREHG